MTKKMMNGMSTIATSVAEVKKSRRLSNSRSMLAKAPDEPLRSRICMLRSWSKIKRPISTSARLPALSMKVARRVLIRKSKPSAMATPTVSATRDSIAWLGMTLS